MGAEFECAVCQNGKTEDVVFLCTECAHPDRVRTYCTGCGHRLDLSLEKAKTLFSHAGLSITYAGVVLRYSRCPMCSPENVSLDCTFTVHQDGFPPCLAAA